MAEGFLRAVRRVSAGTLLLLVVACAVQLAPDYDRRIVDGLTAVNRDAMTLFASLAGGADAAGFAGREARYDAIIGTLDALRIETGARPTPQPYIARILGARRTPAGIDEVVALEAPTPDIIATMSRTMARMREVDSKQGLTPVEVEAFKGNIVISMDQALTYERALER